MSTALKDLSKASSERQLPGSSRIWHDPRPTRYEALVIAMHDHIRRRPTPTVDELQAGSPGGAVDTVIDRLRKSGEAADRQLSAFLTAAAFLVALAGAPIATAQDSPGLYVPAAFSALIAFLFALRGLTRNVEGIPGLAPTWGDVGAARNALAAKAAWGWAAARLLRFSAGWLLVLTVLLSCD